MGRKNQKNFISKIPYKKPHNNPVSNPNLNRHERKEYLVKMLGGHCTKCGYNKSVKALSFHHINPKNKLFDISNNGNMMRNWAEVILEAKKCELLCLNCHSQINNKK